MSSNFESIAKLASNNLNEDDLLTTDEVKVYTDEGDGENKNPENLLEDKQGLVDQSDESSVDVLKPISNSFKLESKDLPKSSNEANVPIVSYVPALYNGVPIKMLPSMDDEKSRVPHGINFNFSNFDIDSIARGTGLPISSTPLSSICNELPQWSNGSYFSMPGTFHDSLIQPFRISSMINSFPPPMFPGSGSLSFSNSGLYPPYSQQYPFNLNDQLRPWDIITDTKPRRPHIKKPLNAFMLFMKEQRGNVVSECTLKESAAINQILGRKWHELSREEQSKYYELARDERLKHMEMYPNWSARDNYGMRKRRRKKREKISGEASEWARKCRARYGIHQIDLWCKPCRRKKKCIRFQHVFDDGGIDDSELAINDLASNIMEENIEEISVVDDDLVKVSNE